MVFVGRPQQLDEPVARAVHRLLLQPVVAPPWKDDDDLRAVAFP
jgi:hypothetical protein